MSEEQATIVIPKVRQGSDVRMTLTLTDNGVAVDWTSLSDIVAMLYSNEQRVLSGQCRVEVDSEDSTKLICNYDADNPEFVGVNSLVVRCTYLERKKTYDKKVLEFVATTDELDGQPQVIEDPELDVTINVEDVSTSLLDNAIAAAFDAALAATEATEVAEEDHERAEADHTIAAADHTQAASDHTTAAADHSLAAADHTQAGQDHTRAAGDHDTAVADHTLAGTDHSTAAADHTQAASDHTRAESDHTQAASDHTTAVADHTLAGTDHNTAVSDHTQAASDHTAAAADHTLAGTDHSTAAADHTQALADHQVMAGYDTRLTQAETDISQLGQEVDGKTDLGSWEIGSIQPGTTDIPDYPSTTRIRMSANQSAMNTGNYIITCNQGYLFLIYVAGKISTATWASERTVELVAGDVYRIAIKTDLETDFSSYTQEQINGVVVSSGIQMQYNSIAKRIGIAEIEIDELGQVVGEIPIVSVSRNNQTGHIDITVDNNEITVPSIDERTLKHITSLFQCTISLTNNQDGTLTATLVRGESQGFIYWENGFSNINITSFSDTFQLHQNGLNIIYYDITSSEIKYSQDINELDFNSIVIEIFYSYNRSPEYWCWTSPIITRTNLQPNGCGSYFADSYLNSVKNRLTHIENWQIPFARLTRLNNSTIGMNYANGVITAILTRVSGSSDGYLYYESGYVSFTTTQTFTLNVIPDGLNVIYYNRENGICITNTINNLTKNDIVLEIFYAYSNVPTLGCWTCPLITKSGFGTGITAGGLRYVNPSEIPVIDFKSYRRATSIFNGTMSMSYDETNHTITVTTNGGYLYDNETYVPISADTEVLALTAGKTTAICWNISQNKFVKYESADNTPVWSAITKSDIILEIFFNYNYSLEYAAIWTTPFITKTGFPAVYENGYNSFSNTKKIKDIDIRVTALENQETKKRAFPYTAKIFRRIGCIGDSYTKGYIYPSGGTATENENYAWPHYMEGLTNNIFTNFGVSGSTAKGWMSGAAKLAQVQAEGNKCQAYIVGLMINDRNPDSWNHYYTPVGVIGDIGTNNDTYYAWYYKLIQAVIAVNPLAPIFCNTCPAYANNDAYNQAVRDIVEYCHTNGQRVYLNDLASDTYKTVDYFLNPTFVADAVNSHYTAIGYEFMAECLKDILSDTINANQSEFQSVHLIPFDAVF